MIKQIVSIEDEAEISELLSVVLDSPQAALIQTYDAYSGLDAIRELHPDLVILDIMLPDLDGWSVYRILREEIGLLDRPTSGRYTIDGEDVLAARPDAASSMRNWFSARAATPWISMRCAPN